MKDINTHWPDSISNNELWKKTGKEPVQEQLRRRKWKWLGHAPRDLMTSTTVDTTRPPKKRNTWRRDMEKEIGRHASGTARG